MQKSITLFILLILICLLPACTTFTVPAETLQPVVAEDLVVLGDTMVSPQALESIGEAQVLFIGENHNQIEHQELLATWVTALHEQGYRQVLLECYQLFDWIINAYVNGQQDTLPRYVQVYYGNILDPIRVFNLTLSEEDRIQVHAIDINHDIDAYFTSLAEFSKTLPQADVIQSFLESANLDQSSLAAEQVVAFYNELLLNETLYRSYWGEDGFETVRKLTWTQKETYPIKKIWNTRNNKAHRLREEVIKQVVDAYLMKTTDKTVINMGGNHAQRNGRMGTRMEWLGEYLAKRSPYAAGKTYLLYVMVYQGEHDDGNGHQSTFSLADNSPQNELFRLMYQAAGGQSAFLPLDDPLFATQRVAVNYRSVIRGFPPKEVYDAYILLPEGHIIRWQN